MRAHESNLVLLVSRNSCDPEVTLHSIDLGSSAVFRSFASEGHILRAPYRDVFIIKNVAEDCLGLQVETTSAVNLANVGFIVDVVFNLSEDG